MSTTREHQRLAEARNGGVPWRLWGPYLSERQWGTVREDYSDSGNAWDYFTHDQARSRAYRWGEDGLAGVSDEKQRLCFAIALWNGADPILKERAFGLSNSEGNHGEDVKEYYFYLDSTPTHSYMRWQYKYPQRAYPYDDLVRTNRTRSRTELEYELLDTGVFDDDRYFDVVVEYAKSAFDDLSIRITAYNRGAEPAPLHLLPTLWFRNRWEGRENPYRPRLNRVAADPSLSAVEAEHRALGRLQLLCEGAPEILFTENETNQERLWGRPNPQPWVKDAFHEFVVHGRRDAVNPAGTGTKCAPLYVLDVPARGEASVCLRLAPASGSLPATSGALRAAVETTISERRREADEFYTHLAPSVVDEDSARILRQAFAGLLWTKQYYSFDVDQWLSEHANHATDAGNGSGLRNRTWIHMKNADVLSMPDKWEYPWYAAWDLAFHAIPLASVDPDFAKQQLELVLTEVYQHPNGQIPAYEWNFSDVNPPVHAWAVKYVYDLDRALHGEPDIGFLKSAFAKLLMNFGWWVNRKDPQGKNLFEGGFLGLDNIGVFDRSQPLPTGGFLEQADGTAWMAFYCQCMVDIALELAPHDVIYEELALKFIQHFLWIAAAMDRAGDHADEMWDEEDGFFYDLVRFSDGSATRLKVRSMVGLLPLCAATVFDGDIVDRFPRLTTHIRRFLRDHPTLTRNISPPSRPGVEDRRLLSILDESKLRRVLARMLDESEFLSRYGIRALSRYHHENPYVLRVHGEEFRVAYEPAESSNGLFGGNSNWRGPIWFPVNALLLRALRNLYMYYGRDFTVECPTGSGRQLDLFQVSAEIGTRLASIFRRDENGRRPVFGGTEKFQTDPLWRDLPQFFEYFHGDNGAGLGASHQTGWTGLIATLILLQSTPDPRASLDRGRGVAVEEIAAPGRLPR